VFFSRLFHTFHPRKKLRHSMAIHPFSEMIRTSCEIKSIDFRKHLGSNSQFR